MMAARRRRSRRWLAVAAVGASLRRSRRGRWASRCPAWSPSRGRGTRDVDVLRRLGVVPVLGVATLAAAVWYLCAFVEQGSAFIDVVFKENVVRFIDTDDAKAGTRRVLYLPLVGLVGALPWVPLLPLVVPRRGARAAVRFAAHWALVVVVFFSLANAKRSVYLLPAFRRSRSASAPPSRRGLAAGPPARDRATRRRWRARRTALALAAGSIRARSSVAGSSPTTRTARPPSRGAPPATRRVRVARRRDAGAADRRRARRRAGDFARGRTSSPR
jgi:hypothetical protein